jgi:hypothetical protein
MSIVVYVFSASFILMMLALFFAYRRTGHYGMFLMGLTYGASAGLAIVLTHWWPLVVGFILVWILKLLGLDPGTNIHADTSDRTGKSNGR